MWSNDKYCYYWDGEQQKDDWKLIRRYGVGSSIAWGLAYGSHYNHEYQTPEYYRQLMFDQRTIEMNDNMKMGIQDEPLTYQWHEKYLKKRCPEACLRIIGIAVSKRNPIFRGSPDSLVYDPTEPDPHGIGEYKRTKKMYFPLISKKKYPRKPIPSVLVDPCPVNPTLLWDSHYTQLQHLMWTTGRTWGDYVVNCREDRCYYVQRIRFNPEFWDKCQQQILVNLKNYLPEIHAKIYRVPSDQVIGDFF